MEIKINKNRKYRAFSFMEVMISVFVLSIGMVAIITLMSGSLRDSMDSRNQIIASGLAQEGTELVKNIRDSNWVSKDAGLSFAHMPALGSDNCTIDKSYLYPATPTCNNAISALQLYTDASGYYIHSNSGTTATKFYRKVSISGDVSNLIVVSMVIWGGGSFPSTTTACNTSTKCAYTQLTLTAYGE